MKNSSADHQQPAISRRLVMTGFSAAATALAPVRPLLAQGRYPSRPVRVLVGFPAGGAIDSVFRVIVRSAEPLLGQPVVIENRPGAGGTVSILQMKNAAPDGYTLGIIALNVFRTPVMENVPYDPLRDITYIAGLSNVPFGIVVRADSRFRSWADLLAYGKANPQRVNYGVSAGLGNSAHLLMEEVTAQERTRWNPIPYKGGPDNQQALLAGDILFAVDGSGSFGPLVDVGQVRMLAMATSTRSTRWPDVPTLTELGHPLNIDSPWGLGGPKGMDPAAVATIESAFRKAVDTQETKDFMLRAGQEARFVDHAAFTAWAGEATVRERALLTKYGFARSP